VPDRPIDGSFWDLHAMHIAGAAANIGEIGWPEAARLQRSSLARLPVERHDLKRHKGVHEEDGAGALWYQRYPILLITALVKVLLINLDDALSTSLLIDGNEDLLLGDTMALAVTSISIYVCQKEAFPLHSIETRILGPGACSVMTIRDRNLLALSPEPGL